MQRSVAGFGTNRKAIINASLTAPYPVTITDAASRNTSAAGRSSFITLDLPNPVYRISKHSQKAEDCKSCSLAGTAARLDSCSASLGTIPVLLGRVGSLHDSVWRPVRQVASKLTVCVDMMCSLSGDDRHSSAARMDDVFCRVVGPVTLGLLVGSDNRRAYWSVPHRVKPAKPRRTVS